MDNLSTMTGERHLYLEVYKKPTIPYKSLQKSISRGAGRPCVLGLRIWPESFVLFFGLNALGYAIGSHIHFKGNQLHSRTLQKQPNTIKHM